MKNIDNNESYENNIENYGADNGNDEKYTDINIHKDQFYDDGDDLSSFSDKNKIDQINYKNLNDSKLEKKRDKILSFRQIKFYKRVWLVMVILISIILTQYLLVGVRDMMAVNRKDYNVINISIPSGSSVSQVSEILNSASVIAEPNFFKNYVRVFKHNYKFTKGDYLIQSNLDYDSILNYLQTQSNRQDVLNITIPEGLNLQECGQLLEKNGICTKEAFLKECNNTEFNKKFTFLNEIQNVSDRYYYLEGYIFPDTYKFYQDSDPKDIIKKCLTNYENKITKQTKEEKEQNIKSIEERAKEKGYTMNELLIIASLVQAEAADESDMEVIASVFENRLNADVNEGFQYLGSDATVYYPHRNKNEAPENYESSYSTYKIKGLPAGPICNPGMDAINAVLDHKNTKYMYFAHDNNGKAYYASTTQQHEANLEKINKANGNE